MNKPVAIVTGASSGIGRATAERLAARGYHVVALARREALLNELCQVVTQIGGSCENYSVDLGDAAAVARVAAELAAKHGQVKLFVSNAGGFHYGDLASTPEEKIAELIRVNVTGTILSTQAFLPLLLKSKDGGRIVYVSSLSGLWGFANMAPYTATKFAVTGFADAMRRELKGSGVTVGTIFPGPVNTALAAGEKSLKRHTLTAPEAAAAIVELAESKRSLAIEHRAYQKIRWLQHLAPTWADRWFQSLFAR